MKGKKLGSLALGIVLAAGLFAGCAIPGKDGGNQTTADGKVKLTIGNWPDETDPTRQQLYQGYIEVMKEKYPDIEITPDTYKYETQTFMAKASAGQLPVLYDTWFTEVSKIIEAGYAADITTQMKEAGYYDKINPTVKSLVEKDGKIYAVPQEAYAQGLFLNKSLFTKAGLINSDGSLKTPATYEELAETAKTIKEKTGAAGFILPGTNNCGGWHFLNIAWSFGADFVEKQGGKWKAVFDTPEGVAALQYVKDLKWKYNALPDNVFIDIPEMQKLFATDQGAMYISNPPANDLIVKYGMNKDNLVSVSMPAGPAGAYAQMGGNVHMLAPNATPEQIDAAMKWIDIIGEGPSLNDEAKANREKRYAQEKEEGRIVLDREAFDVWSGGDRTEQDNALRQKYTNIDPKDYEKYYAFEDITINPEPAMNAQELYKVLDGCIQEVLTNQEADCKALMEKAAKDFQANYLDKVKE